MHRPHKDKRPTWTSLVLALLRQNGEFMSVRQLGEALGPEAQKGTRIHAALHHLRNYQARRRCR